MPDAEVLAAGGVVLRDGEDGDVELLMVHRPRYDDWTLPKGKLDEGETFPEAALREVEEETGFRCRLGDEVAVTDYVDGHGRTKTVRYYLMDVLDGTFVPGDEVDEIRWVHVAEARRLLSYARDLPVLDALG